MHDRIRKQQFNDMCCLFCQIDPVFCSTLSVKKKTKKNSTFTQQVFNLTLVKENALQQILFISEMQANLLSLSSKKLHNKSPWLKITTYVCMRKVKKASSTEI